KNDITRETPASFEPTIDYVVTKIPRFAFEKFPQADPTLTTQMKSVGEAMAIGRTFKESLQKCLRSLEIGRSGLGGDGKPWRIGSETYGDRDILPRGRHQPQTELAQRRTHLLHPPRPARRLHHRGDFRFDQD